MACFPKWQTFHHSVGCSSRLPAGCTKVAQGNQFCSCAHLTPNQSNILAKFGLETNDVVLTVRQTSGLFQSLWYWSIDSWWFWQKISPRDSLPAWSPSLCTPPSQKKREINNVGAWGVSGSSCLGPCLLDDVRALQVWLIASLVSSWQLILSRGRRRMQMVFVKDACKHLR